MQYVAVINGVAREPTLCRFGTAMPRCQATSKRTGLQCGAACVRGKRVCKWHGGKSTGPRTKAGRQRCAAARTFHGRETRQRRAAHRIQARELAALVRLGRMIGLFKHKDRGS